MENRPRVLCVDDSTDMLRVLELLIPSRGLAVETADSSREALALFNRGVDNPALKIDCIITDIDLQRITGLTLAKTIHEVSPSLPVIFLTGYDDQIMRGLACKAGIVEFFVKPPDPKQFLDAVEKEANHYYKSAERPTNRAALPVIIEQMITRYNQKIGLAAAT